jgi:hypothetical protein
MKFDGNTAWYIPNMNNNRSSSYPITKLWDQDFTYCVRFKVDWDAMVIPNEWSIGGLVVRNGAHFGINTVVGTGDDGVMLKAFESTLWVTKLDRNVNPSTENIDNFESECLSIKIDSNNSKKYFADRGTSDGIIETINWDGWINCVFTSEYNKRLTLQIDGFTDTIDYDNTLLDYSSSWLWLGCCNGFSGLDTGNNYFTGEVSHIGLFQKCFNKKDRKLFFENLNDLSVLNNYNLNPIAMTDFKKKTPYKIYDLSENGNHFTIYGEEWMNPMNDIQPDLEGTGQ